MRDAGPTCYPSSGAPSRIDRALANRRAREWLVSAELRWDLGIATHAGLQLDFVAVQPEPAMMRECRQSLEGDPAPGWDDRRDESTAQVAGKWAPVVERA
eukprot:10188932-Lingulodinium_polyedra.AAC.1